MNWEFIAIAFIVIFALTMVIRNYYRVLAGREKYCDSCPVSGSCSVEDPEEIAERLRKGMKKTAP